MWSCDNKENFGKEGGINIEDYCKEVKGGELFGETLVKFGQLMGSRDLMMSVSKLRCTSCCSYNNIVLEMVKFQISEYKLT